LRIWGGTFTNMEIPQMYNVRRDIGLPFTVCKTCGGCSHSKEVVCICDKTWFRPYERNRI